MSEKRPRWEDEMMGGKLPNPKACATCMFRPTEYNGLKLDRADTDTCGIFEDPETKPAGVYWDGADCEQYEKAV